MAMLNNQRVYGDVPPLPPPDAAEGSSTKRLAETEVADGLGGVWSHRKYRKVLWWTPGKHS